MTNIKELLNNNRNIKILKHAGSLGDKLSISTYLVGGYVRDLLLGKKTKDIDIMVDKDSLSYAKKLSKKLKVNKTVEFEKFLTARIPHNEFEIEIANAREESYNEKSRNPNIVKETTVTQDLSRRDFTINALAVSLNKNNFGELTDSFNGIIDLSNQLIKTPLAPDETFKDDPLRMIRAIRFATQLQFKIDKETLNAIKRNKDRITLVSTERITSELFKILESDKPSIGFYLFDECDLNQYVFPELTNMKGVEIIDNKGHKDVFIHTLEVVDNAAQLTKDMKIRFAALVHDIAKPATKRFDKKKGWTFHGHDEIGRRMLTKTAKRMKLSRELKEYLMLLTKLHLRPIALAKKDISDKAIRRLMFEAGEHIDDLMILCRADITTKNPHKIKKYLGNFERVEKLMKDVVMRDEMRAFQSPVDGNKIMEVLKLKEGRKVGEIKKDIENAILDEVIPNTYEDAFEYMMKIKDNY